MALISIQKVQMKHRSGTKEYNLLLVQNHDNGKGLIVNRWGKTGSWGQMETFAKNATDCLHQMTAKIREKEGRGYSVTFQDVKDAKTFEEAKNVIGVAYWMKLGSENIWYVMPGADVTGVKEEIPKNWTKTEDGKWVAEDEPRHSMPSAEEELAEKKTNPNWGLF